MSNNQTTRAGAWADDEYQEFERKMELIENGPTCGRHAIVISHSTAS